MTKLFLCAGLVIVAASMTVASGNRDGASRAGNEASFATDGAFRDGLYLGRLASANGEAARVAIGRWSTAQDCAMFRSGYQRGYESGQRVVASRR